MPSRTEQAAPRRTVSRRAPDSAAIWNRKTHYYLGLYFLFFLWLFAFTGLLLNHSSWKFAEFWPNRKVSGFERQVEAPRSGSDLDRARDVARQLGITGEIEWAASKPDSTLREFRVNRPGHNFVVTVNQDVNRANVQHTEINPWGVMRVLHTFTGLRAGDTRNQRDWILTTVWALSMDAVSAGLVVMVLSGLYMWYGLPSKRKSGMVAFVLGTMTCGVFVAGIRWLYS
ncbi:MAG: hypothetical protein ACRD8O_24425 [Bryobacteraceae bacterium]